MLDIETYIEGEEFYFTNQPYRTAAGFFVLKHLLVNSNINNYYQHMKYITINKCLLLLIVFVQF